MCSETFIMGVAVSYNLRYWAWEFRFNPVAWEDIPQMGLDDFEHSVSFNLVSFIVKISIETNYF